MEEQVHRLTVGERRVWRNKRQAQRVREGANTKGGREVMMMAKEERER